jgi:hypothetical protein
VAKARAKGIDEETRFKKAAELMDMKLLAQLVTDRHRDGILQKSQTTPEQIRAYYDQHQSQFLEEPRFTARHLVVYVKGNPAFPDKGQSDAEARKKAEQALSKLRAGATWDEVVAAYSDEVTKSRGGLIRDAQFGHFAPEVERAVRAQELGKPGNVVRSAFGYHILQVEARILEKRAQPFEKVAELCAERLTEERSSEAAKAFISPIREEMGLTTTDAGQRDTSLLREDDVAPTEVLAQLGGRKVLESDFRWFLEDAVLPSQRTLAYSRPGARLAILSSFLDMLVLQAKARKEGLDKTPEYLRRRASTEDGLLSEFMQERDKVSPRYQHGLSDEEQKRVRREYFDRVRAEVHLVVTGGSE